MKKNQIIEAWKNPEYRQELGEQIDLLPEHPAGWFNLTDSELGEVFGGMEEVEALHTEAYLTFAGCCHTVGPACFSIACTMGAWTYGCCPN